MVNRGGTTGKLGHLPLQRRLRDQYGEHADGDAHLFPPEDVYKSAKRKQFYRILGQASSMRVDLSQHTVEVNDLILLCTNGLWHMLQDDKLAEILAQGGDPQKLARTLVDAANLAGGEGNVSAVVVKVQ